MQSPWLALVCILMFAATVATFVSHTVAALILLPIITKIGVNLGIAEVTVIGAALASKIDHCLHVLVYQYMSLSCTLVSNPSRIEMKYLIIM